MRKIAIIGSGYVGLVTGVCLAEVGHDVTCIDVNAEKIEKLKQGISPIFEPGLEKLMIKNMDENRLSFTTKHVVAFHQAEVIYIAVGTPQKADGAANLDYIYEAARDIARYVFGSVIVVLKSTVPVGTNEMVKSWIETNSIFPLEVEVVSNPEFLREGQAVHDTFHADRIVIGANSERAASVIAEINEPFQIPIFRTDIRSAEMIKYASNAFLATKISFINEIATICEKMNANIEDVALGMGQDSRIGTQFLKAGIGYGGSCFPKDTKALIQIAGNVNHKFELLEAVIYVNNKQQIKLVEKAKEQFGSLLGMKVTILGLAFKPNTDDVRQSASIVMANALIQEGAIVTAYDPIAMDKAKEVLPKHVTCTDNIIEALYLADMVFIATDWDEIKNLDLAVYAELMNTPIIFDGRNCYSLHNVQQHSIEYHSIGRRSIMNLSKKVVH